MRRDPRQLEQLAALRGRRCVDPGLAGERGDPLVSVHRASLASGRGTPRAGSLSEHGRRGTLRGMPDRLGRPLRDLRISVTDRCNLRCPYCMPREVYGAGFRFLPRHELLSFEEITRLVAALAGEGLGRLRLTGGEPLLRRDLERLVEMLAAIDGIGEIALTTNGTLLADRARELREAGLSRVTVSLDALAEDVARRMSDARLEPVRVLAGIDAAIEAGLSPVKVNMVVRRGINDRCVLEMAEHFR